MGIAEKTRLNQPNRFFTRILLMAASSTLRTSLDDLVDNLVDIRIVPTMAIDNDTVSMTTSSKHCCTRARKVGHCCAK